MNLPRKCFEYKTNSVYLFALNQIHCKIVKVMFDAELRVFIKIFRTGSTKGQDSKK